MIGTTMVLPDEHLVVIDGHNMLMRAWYAPGAGLTDADGINTGPLMFFIGSLAKNVCDLSPTRLVVVFDEGPSTRHAALDPNYKIDRLKGDGSAPDVFLVRDFLRLAGIPVESQPGVEADDLIGRYWRQCSRWRMTIVSDDKDFLQLLCPSCEQIRPSAKEPLWTADRLRVEHGCEPDEWAMVLALAGDKADGVIGVPGIGVVKAVRLLHSLENVPRAEALAFLTEHGPDKVVECGGRLLKNYQMVNLRDGLGHITLPEPPPFQPVVPGQEGWDALSAFLDQHQMTSIQQRYERGTMWTRESLTDP